MWVYFACIRNLEWMEFMSLKRKLLLEATEIPRKAINKHVNNLKEFT